MTDKSTKQSIHSNTISSLIPALSQWNFLDKNNVEKLIKIEDKNELLNFIKSTLSSISSENEDLLVYLLLDLVNFCKSENYDSEKCGAALSIFYQTHVYFTRQHNVSADKVYDYFKGLLMCHSLPFPPKHKKILSILEGQQLCIFFCKIYLRHLPLIAHSCLPNLAVNINYEISLPKDAKEKKKTKK